MAKNNNRMMEGEGTEMANAASDLKEKAGDVVDSVRDLAGTARDAAVQQAHRVRDVAMDKVEQARDTAVDYYERGREKAGDWADDLEEYIQGQPLKSVMIAAGIGILLGMYWKRR